MRSPKFSVVVPAYNHEKFLPEAIESVLQQTYANFELIIVNDGSTDNTRDVVHQFKDSRIKYIEQVNQGASAARNSGIRISTGEFIAFLDADDIWHKDKLKVHHDYHERYPGMGVTYNPRFDLNYSRCEIRSLWWPPDTVTLSDLVIAFPFSPSDMVVRRELAFDVGLFDESFVFYGDDLDFYCKLALAGCQFRSVLKALNYRRYHAGRIIRNIPSLVDVALKPLHKTFSDPRCPQDVLEVQDQAFANHYLSWANMAYAQGEPIIGKDLLTRAIKLNPSILKGKPCLLLQNIVSFSISDENKNHEELLRSILDHLPDDITWLSDQYSWAARYGYLMKWILAIMWGQTEYVSTFTLRATDSNVNLDEYFVKNVTYQFLTYDKEFGVDAANELLKILPRYMRNILPMTIIHQIQSSYFLNKAFQHFYLKNYPDVLSNIVFALTKKPQLLVNKGLLSVFFRSLIHMWK